MKRRKGLAFILALSLVLSSFSVAFATDVAEETTPVTETTTEAVAPVATATNTAFADIAGHWAKDAIVKWADYGVVKGSDGVFRPDAPLTRAEMATVLSNLMDYKVAAKNNFSDVATGAWYADAVLKANAAGVLSGDGSGLASPSANITREQATSMLARAFAVADANGTSSSLTDTQNISSWARPAVFGMEAAGYVRGFEGKFNPKNNITRAEVMTIINSAVKAYYTAAGTYTENVDGLAVVKVPGVVLKDVVISGNLIAAEGIASGDLTLDGKTEVKGKLIVRGGGENSIIIKGSAAVLSIEVSKVDGKMRIFADGALIKEITALKGEIILEGNFTNVEVKADATVIIKGNVGTLSMESKGTVDIQSGTVTTLDIPAGATATIAANATVTTANITGAADIKGTGAIGTANISGTGATIVQTPTAVNVADGGAATVGGKTVDGATSAAPSTGGGRGNSSNTVAVSAISVDKEATTLPVGTSETLVATVSPSDATNKAVTWTTSDASVATVADGVVTAVSEGTATITATSNNGKTATTTVTVVAANTVAMIGTTQYDTLKKAVAAVQNGDTVKLIANTTGDGIVVPSNSNFTLDLNGKTYTVNGQLVGSSGTESQGFQLLKDSNITIKNGGLTTTNAKMLIQNYSNLTLDNVELVGADVTQYVLSNNFGDTKLENGTTITAATGKFAFDVYYWPKGGYPSVTVEIASDDVVITGNVEYAGDGSEGLAENAKLIIPTGYTLTPPAGYEWVGQDGKQVLIDASTVAMIDSAQYTSLAAAMAAATSGDTINILKDCTIVGATAKDKDLTFVGNSSKPKVTFPQKGYQTYYGCDFTFENLTLECAPDENYQGIQPDKVIARNCVINGKFWGYAKDLEFTDCVFNQNSSYNIWTYGSNVTFDNCEFNSAGRSVLIYNEGATKDIPAKITINNSKFINTGNVVSEKAAIEISTQHGGSFEVVINNSTAEGFDIKTATGGIVLSEGLANLKYIGTGTLTVTIDGKQVLADGLTYDADSDTYEISNANGLIYANKNLFNINLSNNKYKLGADIDMSDVTDWNSNVSQTTHFELDGGGYKISGLKTTSDALLVPRSQYTVTIKNLTLENCEVNTESEYAAMLVGYADANTVTIDNCNIINGKVQGANYAGALIGWSSKDININSSSVENTSILGDGSTGGIVGHCVGDESGIANITDVTIEDCTINGQKVEKSGIVVGTANVGKTTITTNSIVNNTVFEIENSDAIYGRFVPSTTGELTVNSTTIN